MAENMSAFDYKTQEEVLTVIRHLTSVLSVVGMALVETISPTTLNDRPFGIPPSTPPPVSNEDFAIQLILILDKKIPGVVPTLSLPLTPQKSTQDSQRTRSPGNFMTSIIF
jgi:cohesin loading factor subunit SCC2